MDRLDIIERHLANLEKAFIDSQQRNILNTEKAESAQSSADSVKNVFSGEYKPKKPYEKDEYCMYNGNLYQFVQTYGKGIEPTNSTYWVACDVATELNKLTKMIKGV